MAKSGLSGVGFSSETRLKVWRAFGRAVAELHRQGVLRTDLDEVNRVTFNPRTETVHFGKKLREVVTQDYPTVDELAQNLVPLMQFVLAGKREGRTEGLWEAFEEIYLESMDERGPQVLARLRVIQEELRRASRLNMEALGMAYLGKLDEAKVAFEESLRIRKENGDHEGYCRTLCNLALVYADANDFDSALNSVESAITWAKEHDRVKGLSLALLQKGLLLSRKGDRVGALQCAELATRVWESTGQPLPTQFSSLFEQLHSGRDTGASKSEH